jgi:phosphatidylglycerophosphate synthase
MKKFLNINLSAIGLMEIGKALLAFANIVIALAIVNIVYKEEEPLLYSVWVFFMFVSLYYMGYRLIKKGEGYV